MKKTVRDIDVKGRKVIERCDFNVPDVYKRQFYDSVREEQGIQNYFVPEEMGELLEKMYKGQLISKQASKDLQDLSLIHIS